MEKLKQYQRMRRDDRTLELLSVYLRTQENGAEMSDHIICICMKVRRKNLGYLNGQKSCSHCEVTYLTKEFRCPCCNRQLRTSNRWKNCVKGQREALESRAY